MFALIMIMFSFFGSVQSNVDGKIHYQIKPIPLRDRTKIEITADLKVKENKPITITLPTDYFGTPNLYRFVESFRGEAGTTVIDAESEDMRILKPNKESRIRVRYVLSYDPELFKYNTYSPNTSPHHFHLAGCQWALQFGDFKEKQHLEIEFKGVPENWQTYSSISSNPSKFETIASYSDLVSTAIGAAPRTSKREYTYKESKFAVIIPAEFDIPKDEIFDAAEKIVTIQRKHFNDDSQKFYNVVVLPRAENVAGVRFENMFITFLKK
ncbi:MAG: hypothetical protein KDB79_13790, partial [Acidobacteria bacterium]|nr:hypothetical protein [Acidobacteriota bacterium]